MKVITRGIPNFAYTTTHEVADLEAFVDAHTLKVIDRITGYAGEYFRPESGERVSLYVEGAAENLEVLRSRCFHSGQTSMKACVITVSPDNGNVRSAGTSSSIRTEVGDWYMVDPKLDPRYAALLEVAKAEAAQRTRLAAIQQDKDDELREKVLDLASGIGYEESLRRLRGERCVGGPG